MSNQLDINGVVHTFPKDFNPEDPYTVQAIPGGISVDWGGGDVDILSGDSSFMDSVSSVENIADGLFAINTRAGLQGCDKPNNPDLVVYNSERWAEFNLSASESGGVVPPNFRVFVDSNQSQWDRWALPGDSFQMIRSAKFFCQWGRVTVRGLLSDEVGWGWVAYDKNVITVTTNLGETSSRENMGNPVITQINATCELIVNYDDGTTYNHGVIPCDSVIYVIGFDCPEACFIADRIIGKL